MSEESNLNVETIRSESAATTLVSSRQSAIARSRGGRSSVRGGYGRGRTSLPSRHTFSGQSSINYRPPHQSSNSFTFNRSTPRPNNNFSSMDVMQLTCYNCHGIGHTANTCSSPKLRAQPHSSSSTAHLATNPNSMPSTSWVMDTGATNHITPNLDNLTFQSDFHGSDEVQIGNGKTLSISHVGSNHSLSHDHLFHLQNIFHVPNICTNLLSVSSFTNSNNVSIEFFPSYFEIKDIHTRQVLITGPNDSGLYSLCLNPVSSSSPHSPHSSISSITP